MWKIKFNNVGGLKVKENFSVVHLYWYFIIILILFSFVSITDS